MSVTSELFGKTADGRAITSYTLDNGKMSFKVIDFGAVLVNLWVPDRNGCTDDIVLGFDTAEQYLENKDYFGATVGPVANRIGGAGFSIGEKEFTLPVNDGPNNLHTDKDLGLHKKLWDALTGDNFVTFTVHVPDGECGLPGNRDFAVTYCLTEDNAVRIHYQAVSDADTLINPTNHTYFNLDGHDAGSIEDTIVQLYCSHYTPTDDHSIPTGEIRPVEGTAFDFRAPKKIGKDIGAQDEQLLWAKGYDHNYCIDGYNAKGDLVKTARCFSEKSGRVMEVRTSLPGVQFYAGNYVDDRNGKGGHDYGFRSGFCLETQYYPDAVHHTEFPSPVFAAGQAYDSLTEYRFTVE